jgi:hypothetical protein
LAQLGSTAKDKSGADAGSAAMAVTGRNGHERVLAARAARRCTKAITGWLQHPFVALGRHWLARTNLAWAVFVELSVSYAAGNGLGSFNTWMRLGTWLAFGLGIAWLLYPTLGGVIRSALQYNRAGQDGPWAALAHSSGRA